MLPDHVSRPLHRFVSWAAHRDEVLADGRLVDVGGKGTGIAALFSGSPGTGKTLAAHVVAAELGLDLFRVDLASIVDKYIGETEKNLERVFHEAESLNVLLFFDEADALFGKRSDVKDAHDRYANQEVAYLLQRMESFDGVTVLATNLRGNLDPAFSRRMQLHRPLPRPGRAHPAAPLGAAPRARHHRPGRPGAGGAPRAGGRARRRRHPQHRARRRVRRRGRG